MQPEILTKKIKDILQEQKNKLENYLKLLDNEETYITDKDADKLDAHIKLETSVITEIESFKKILDPLEKIYSSSPYKKDDTIMALKNSINHLCGNIKIKSDDNKEKLQIALEEIRVKLAKKKSFTHSAYSNVKSEVLDIHG